MQPGAVDAILAELAVLLGEPALIEARQLSSGASRETFALATSANGELILQVERGVKPGSSAPPPQASLLRAAAAAGVPVAPVLADGVEPGSGRSWIAMQALPGTADPGAILDHERPPGPEALLDSVAAALAAVHRMDADPALAPRIEDPLGALRATHDALGEPHPTFELAFRTLERAAPPPAGAPRLVHGDFRLGNLLAGPEGVTGVLDWELTHLGDPVEDLGWLCVPAWRFSRPDRPAAGLGSREQLLSAYERHGGTAVDPHALAWWELFGTLRWGVICVMQAFTHLSGAARSVEHAVIGRRAAEVEWDLLGLLAPTPTPTSPAGPPAGGRAHPPRPLHDRPTAVELLDAARGALGDDVLPLLDGRAAFQTRVVMRALGIVKRELEQAPGDAALHAAVLAELSASDDAALAAAIRAGDFDGREDQLGAGLRALVERKLAAANPRYLQITTAITASMREGA